MAKEGKEIKEADEVKENRAEIAAFFDLDGTLIAGPSLERRFFRELRYRREIGAKNYLWWMAQALRLAPRGIAAILQANKMYLRGVAAGGRERNPSGGMKQSFLPDAIERIAWHAERGDTIVVVSGTLELLAQGAARELETVLTQRRVAAKMEVCATRLEEKDKRWTGQIVGEAMFGGAKARAAWRFAARRGCDLKQSFAYGDSIQDWWLLDAVGNPWVVNPSPSLSRLAQQKNWPILWWNEAEELAQRAQRTQRKAEPIKSPGSLG